MRYDEKAISSKYIKHKNEQVIRFVCDLFEEAYKNKFIKVSDIKFALNNKFISKNFFNRLRINY